MTHHLRTAIAIACALGVTGALAVACVEAPPALPALASKPLSIRLHVFGADAEDAHDAVVSLKRNNPGFAVVQDGGDGDVLIGIEKDSAQCVEPTALCSYRISYRVRRVGGEVVLSRDETVLADSDSCSRLCDKALNKVAIKAVEDAANALRDAPAAAPSASAPSPAESASAAPGAKAAPGSSAKTEPSAKPPPGGKPAASDKPPAGAAPADAAAPPTKGMCSVAVGPALPAKEAERRVAQVDALKRLGVIDEAEFDCLRKAYLERL